jgi:outer membrane protein assembly factor BamB
MMRGLPGLLLSCCAALLVPLPAGAGDWPTYGFSVSRAGFNPAEKVLRAGRLRSLHRAWSARRGGRIDAQPVVASGRVYAGTEGGRFVALNASNGHVVWSRKLGAVRSSCPDLPRYGVTGTPVINGDRVYVGTNGKVFELDAASGKTKRVWTITDDPRHEHNWSALTLSNGVLYAGLAGICDATPYRGRLVAIDTVGGAPAGTWYVTGTPPDSPLGGGIWSFGGLSVDAGGDLFAATGNSVAVTQHVGYAEHVVRLAPDLRVVSSDYPGLDGADADFGATPLLFEAPGCPPQLAVGNKGGSFFLYDRDRIGAGPLQRVRLGGSDGGASALLGVAAYWPARRMVFVSNPLPRGGFPAGMVAFRVTSKCRLARAWVRRGPRGLTSSPTVAGGVVWYGTGFGGELRALSARTGHRLRTLDLRRPIFAAPAVVDGTVYAGGWGGKLYAFRR